MSVKLVASTRRRPDRRRRGEGARRRRPRRRRGRRHRREPARLDQARRRTVGARARRDTAGARRERASRPGARPGGRGLQDRPRRASCRAPRRRRVLVRHRASPRRRLSHGALLPPRHVPGRDREPAARAARQVRGDARDGRGVPPLRRARGARAPRRARPAHHRRGRRPHRPAPAAAHRRSGSGRARARPAARAARRRADALRRPAGASRGRSARLAPRRTGQGRDQRGAARRARLRDHERRPRDRRPARRRDRAGVSGDAPPAGRVRARFEGAAGQSFGAFLTAGVELQLVGEANDYVGKAMSGGRIVVSPPAGDAGEPCLVGNTVLYGATGGELFCAGSAGERFAVRNSGAVTVVEGVGDHACEYMTRGTVVVLGDHGRNLGAGMTGGEAFLLDPDERLVNDELVTLLPLERSDAERLVELLERHERATGSPRAAVLLAEREDLARSIPAPRAARRAWSRPSPRPRAALPPREHIQDFCAYYADAVRHDRRSRRVHRAGDARPRPPSPRARALRGGVGLAGGSGRKRPRSAPQPERRPARAAAHHERGRPRLRVPT